LNRTLLIVIVVTLLLAASCVCIAGSLGALTYITIRSSSGEDGSFQIIASATQTPYVIRPTSQKTPIVSATPGESSQVVETLEAHIETLNTLEEAQIPINDPIGLAQRLDGRSNLSTTTDVLPTPLEVGAKESFWVLDSDDNRHSSVPATLRYVTDHLYFWIEDGVKYSESDLKDLAETFEIKIYPTNRAFFGSEWTPGVDGDPHLYVLYARGLGGTVAGYFSSGDEYPPTVKEYSNGHEMFLLSADRAGLDEEYTYGVLAHEFQHMIHWYRDLNEETWLNEGFSELAMHLNGYDTGGADHSYTEDPDIQLTDWPLDSPESYAHYGSSFLFVTYFLDRFGEDATQALIALPDNGMDSIDTVLAELGAVDPLTEKSVSSDDVFSDWVVASYLVDGKIGDGRYTYNNYPDAPSPSETETISSCPTELITRDVSQYGVDYIRINCQGDHTLYFEGSMRVGVLPIDPHSGSYAFYSNRGDESDMTLTQTFDFTDHSGPLTLTYWTWYDLEEDYDYLYLTASTDGENWQILETPSGTTDDPSGNSYGWAYNGASGNGPVWIQETIDISQYAGDKVQIRFEYVTDAAANGEGFLLDDIAVPEIGYFSDFENDNGGWQADGFVRIQNVLPQIFSLSLIKIGESTTVERIDLGSDNSTDIPINLDAEIDEIVLVVSGMTPFTRQRAPYQFSIMP